MGNNRHRGRRGGRRITSVVVLLSALGLAAPSAAQAGQLTWSSGVLTYTGADEENTVGVAHPGSNTSEYPAGPDNPPNPEKLQIRVNASGEGVTIGPSAEPYCETAARRLERRAPGRLRRRAGHSRDPTSPAWPSFATLSDSNPGTPGTPGTTTPAATLQGTVRAVIGPVRLLTGTGGPGQAVRQSLRLRTRRLALGSLVARANTRLTAVAATRVRGRRRALGKASVLVAPGTPRTLSVKLSRKAKSALRRLERASVEVRFTAIDPARNRVVGRSTTTFRLSVER